MAKGPQNGKWKKKNIAHLKCYNPKGHSYGWSLASSSFESQDISRPVMAPFNGVFCRKPFFPEKKWSTYCKYFSLWQIWGMCGGHTHLITSHQWPSLLAAPSHPTALCVTNDKNTQWTKGLQTLLLREDINRKKTFSFGHCPNEGGGVYPCPNFWPSF